MKNLNKTRGILISLAVLLVFSFSFSCYTTFKHPQIYSYSDSTDIYHSEEITFLNDCSSCHEQDDPVQDVHLQLYDYPGYHDNYNWQYYFAMPWWVDPYYYGEQPGELSNQLPAPQRRDFERRDVPPSPATSMPGGSGATLSKPSSSDAASSETSPPKPQQRNERREAITDKKSESQKTTIPSPTRKEKEQQESKKKEKK
jgi:hypothetical protein